MIAHICYFHYIFSTVVSVTAFDFRHTYLYLNIVVVKSSVVSGEERYGGYVRKGIGTMELEVDEMLVELRQNAEYTDNYDIASDNHLVYHNKVT